MHARLRTVFREPHTVRISERRGNLARHLSEGELAHTSHPCVVVTVDEQHRTNRCCPGVRSVPKGRSGRVRLAELLAASRVKQQPGDAEIVGRVAATHIAEIDHRRPASIIDDQISAVDIAVHPGRRFGPFRCRETVAIDAVQAGSDRFIEVSQIRAEGCFPHPKRDTSVGILRCSSWRGLVQCTKELGEWSGELWCDGKMLCGGVTFKEGHDRPRPRVAVSGLADVYRSRNWYRKSRRELWQPATFVDNQAGRQLATRKPNEQVAPEPPHHVVPPARQWFDRSSSEFGSLTLQKPFHQLMVDVDLGGGLVGHPPRIGRANVRPMSDATFDPFRHATHGPLDGVTVIDLTQVVAGPVATMLLSDLGADVIKVEPPGAGDLTRYGQFAKGGINSAVVACNRGKQSIQIDIAQDAGRDLVLSLIADADVVVQNMRPGVMERLGVGWHGAVEANPDIIYCSMSGYGPTGPYADRAVYDPIIQAMAGYVALQVNPQVPIPDLVRNGVIDKAAGWTAAMAISSALYARERGAGGQHIELSMLDTAIQFLWPDGGMADTLLDDDATSGMRLAEIYQLSQCADGYLVYFVISDAQFAGLFRALDHPEWCDEYATTEARHGKREEIGAKLVNAFLDWKVADLLPRMHENSVPCGHVNQMEDLASDPQVVHCNTFVEWDHPTGGRMRTPRMAPVFSATQANFKASAPLLNEDVDAVLNRAGISAEQRQVLVEAGVLFPPPNEES